MVWGVRGATEAEIGQREPGPQLALRPARDEPGSRENRIDGSWSTPRGAARGADQRW